MSKYITMVDVDEDYLQHGKFIAKVKGLGGKVRYFYNNNEYMAFLKGGKKGYESQKKTNQMNKAANERTSMYKENRPYGSFEYKQNGALEWNNQHPKGSGVAYDEQQKARAGKNGHYRGKVAERRDEVMFTPHQLSTTKGESSSNIGKMEDEIRKQISREAEPNKAKENHSKYVRSKVIADGEAVKNEASKRKMNEGKANDAAAKSKQLDERVKQTRQKVITKQMNAGRDELDKPRVTTYSDDDYNIVGNTISGREVDERYKQYTRDNQKKRQELDTALRKSGKTMSDDTRAAFEQELSKSRQDKLNKYANDAINTPEGLAAYQKNVEAIEEARKSAFEQRYNETGERIDAEREKMKKKKYVK